MAAFKTVNRVMDLQLDWLGVGTVRVTKMQTRCLLALRQHQLRATPNRCTVIRRSFGTDVLIHPVTSLSQAYLTFGSVFQSIPLPEFLPPHAAAIIAATIVLRTCVTLPLTIWSRRRVRRFRDEVLPRLKDAKLQYAREFRELKKEKNAKLAEELFHDFKSQYQPKLAAYYARLVEYHSCSPLKTLLIPIAMHFPVFIVSSLALREASVPPTPLLYETFLSEASLAQSDTFGFFPIAIGVTSLINFEVSRRFFFAPPWRTAQNDSHCR
ncbi:uncharacterized protein EI90DRAFT_1756570 [Cantharellus anzutake]|uniref:uncharacterized protein n=1 Tax=Cantharellus anzutake TaxID=1750568 RepID=UPI0019072910|nr:uncharacterized protein EI90DRAFT_1756570 [Cantharellus anzutake]KAF8341578.1 hypothetical protein EI90DRAFT_1756570 [Cantharellus anzutake]